MNKTFDIRAVKKRLRDKYKNIRLKMDGDLKEQSNLKIRRRIFSLPEYKRCKTVLCFVSTPIEVDTKQIIEMALADRKTVAVPYCIDGTRNMQFYSIYSLDELTPRTFGVLEPTPDPQRLVDQFLNSICILPGLSFDRLGFRLGYGGGYYDRFLSKVYAGGIAVGVCYDHCIAYRLPRGRFDIPCDILVSESRTCRIPKSRQDVSGHTKKPLSR